MGGEVLERPLSLRQFKDLLNVHESVVLVGGQALAFWADYYDVMDSAYAAGFTRDLDFLGGRAEAKMHIADLTARFSGDAIKADLASMDTPPPSAAVILVGDFYGPDEPLVIDYVTALAGYQRESELRMLRRTVEISVDAVTLKCLHPFDCLKSRVHNLILLPAKKNELGREQCRTAIRVAERTLVELCSQGTDVERKLALPMVEAVIELTAFRDGLQVRREHNINVLDAVPVSAFRNEFQTIRWPRAVDYIERKYQRLIKRY